MSHRPTHWSTTCSYQAVVRNTRNTTDAQIAMQSNNRNTQRMHAKKNNARNQFYSQRALHFSCACVAVLFICVAWPVCIASVALHTAAWKPTFKSVFIGLRAVSKLSYATDATQSKTEIHNACTGKTQRTHQFYSLRALHFSAFFVCIHCVRCIRCVARHASFSL